MTPDNAFEGGGLFAKLGAHEQKTRQLQDQRKKEYNDILKGAAHQRTTDHPAITRNATDAQKMERRIDEGRQREDVRGNRGLPRNDDDHDGGQYRTKKRWGQRLECDE